MLTVTCDLMELVGVKYHLDYVCRYYVFVI